MARTRSTKSAPATKAEASDASSTTAKYALPDESSNAPKLFIVPQKATKEARIVSLPNPRYSKPTRYLTCPETGLYEFTKIAAPKTSPRSWMIETSISALESNDSKECKFEAHITNGADLFIATPIDPLFVLLPGLFGSANAKSNEAKRLFLSSDDHLDALDTSSSHLAEALRCPNTRALLESRMEAVCDTVDAGDEKMYRLSEQKLVREVLAKARSMGLGGLPASMEEKFVKKALEAPIQVQKSQAATAGAKSVADEAAGETSTPTPKLETEESQTSTSTVDSTQSALSQASTAATEYVEETVVSAILASDEVVGLQRLRVAFNFICSSYIAPETTATLKKMLSDEDMTGVDFAPLDDYLAQLTKLRAEAASSRSMADYSRKRMLDEEEEEARAEKKRRVEEDKKKKATQSRGIKVLEKVNTKGMKKMSDFFKKK
ncbi:hypothetical protein C8034_v000222 [Colletotrichum sidae]|uniref:Ribonuclease H2 subunit B n=1 Tax=Colletotrichum sidae TaxID=1347389 RepID=A0A4R8TPE9_9PEZI|nr:hypothetical protein C8034_v000222 [Colletotrichum sidae]